MIYSNTIEPPNSGHLPIMAILPWSRRLTFRGPNVFTWYSHISDSLSLNSVHEVIFVHPYRISILENKSFPWYEWDLPQRFACKEHESFMEAVSKGLCNFPQNLVPPCWVSFLLLHALSIHFKYSNFLLYHLVSHSMKTNLNRNNAFQIHPTRL